VMNEDVDPLVVPESLDVADCSPSSLLSSSTRAPAPLQKNEKEEMGISLERQCRSGRFGYCEM
jgi:hypothetical protein